MIYHQDNWRTIYHGDSRKMDLPDESIQCVVTSPPYWGLRKYDGLPDINWDDGSVCQFGLEPTIELYVEHTLVFLKEIWRVLRKDGTVFWNIGDSYAGGGKKGDSEGEKQKTNRGGTWGNNDDLATHKTHLDGIKPKDLCLIPFRVALAAQAQGWWVRSDIIWNKPNPMPESVQDRPTNAYEHIFLFTKSSRYYWDMEAVREEGTGTEYDKTRRPLGRMTGTRYITEGVGQQQVGANFGNGSETRNLRDVWTFPTKGYSGAHFAVFPPELPERCIKAGTPEYGCCDKCGRPYERMIEKTNTNKSDEDKIARMAELGVPRTSANLYTGHKPSTTNTLGWQQVCKCENSNPVPSTVLDPFCGSGTTLLVAAKLGRKAIGYELSSKYTELIIERNRQAVLGE
jgi:DNA modification methylase